MVEKPSEGRMKITDPNEKAFNSDLQNQHLAAMPQVPALGILLQDTIFNTAAVSGFLTE
ncbi:hypothetical protein D1AOALGA4SA_10086 [Olavius algarvensis Delta 1 endosymbiont]|nr:hypothetical protein D1AOALGA4SA_10086 [Olavius algarvensis Delta 1 endosymbiont]